MAIVRRAAQRLKADFVIDIQTQIPWHSDSIVYYSPVLTRALS